MATLERNAERVRTFDLDRWAHSLWLSLANIWEAASNTGKASADSSNYFQL